MSKNFSIEGWQGILRGQAMPGDIMCGESIAEYMQRKFGTLIAECDALQQRLNVQDQRDDELAELLREIHIIARAEKVIPARLDRRIEGAIGKPTEYDYREDLRAYFGLSYASWLTIPRVLMEAMPDNWQRRAARLLHEYSDAIKNPPPYGTTVRVTRDGKIVKAPEWLINYRHPDREALKEVFGKVTP